MFHTAAEAEVCYDMPKLEAQCPTGCTCCLQNAACPEPSLSISCTKETAGDQLSQQFNKMLRSLNKSEMKPLSSLTFSTATLSELPEELCQLKSLRELRLFNLGLQKISHKCFVHLRTLTTLIVNQNNITKLPTDLFEEMTNLELIDFQSNKIVDLQPELFLPLVNVTALKFISFRNNSLQSLDKWPLFFRRATGLQINLDDNNISNFTDMLNFSFKCSEMLNRKGGDIFIRYNKIRHVSDFLKGWSFTGIRDINIFCLATITHIKFYLDYNPLICDCIDYEFYLIGKRSLHIPTHSEAIFCADPPNLRGMLLINLLENGDVFFCNITEKCPNKCRCENHPNQAAVTISCDQDTYSWLPYLLPELPLRTLTPYLYIINMTSNQIKHLESRVYLNKTGQLYLSNNLLAYVEIDAWKQLQLASIIRINHNQLTFLPPDIQLVNLTQLKEIHLYNNPWSCDCHALWMKRWIISLGDAVISSDSILCHSNDIRNGISITRLNDDLFVCYRILSSTEYIIILVPSIVGAGFLLASVFIFTIYLKRHWLFVKFNWHIFDIDECNGEEMDYDAFISYASEDEQNVINLVNMLEQSYSYKICYHRRDFQPGVSSLVNMETAIRRSKRTVCFVTENFLRSDWCLWEFMMALNFDLERKLHRLIVVKANSLNKNDITYLSMKFYLFNYTYVEYPSQYWLKNLLYWLPQRKVLEINEAEEGSENALVF